MTSRRADLVGNRLALVGTTLYLLEWVLIVAIPDVPTQNLGSDQASVVDTYTENPQRLGFASAWFAIVLLGRVAFVAGVRDALRAAPRQLPLADFALGAMIVSVTVEIISMALAGAAAWLAHSGSDASAIIGLDAAADVLFTLVFVLFGVAVFAGALAMLLSGLFRRWIPFVGIFGSALVIAPGVAASATLGTTGTLHDLGNPLGIPLMWLWMIATSIVIFRSKPRPTPVSNCRVTPPARASSTSVAPSHRSPLLDQLGAD
jgi:hypothetical protein